MRRMWLLGGVLGALFAVGCEGGESPPGDGGPPDAPFADAGQWDANGACIADPLANGCPCDPGTDPVPGCSWLDCSYGENSCGGMVYLCTECPLPDIECEGHAIYQSHCDPPIYDAGIDAM